MKKWVIGQPDPGKVSTLQRQSDLSELCCKVLVSQGCVSIEQASERFGCSALSDPFLIVDMQEAAQAVNAAIDNGKRICVYGDYDCDGVMATVILYTFLNEMGADVTWRIPERSEGYGLNENAVREMASDGVQMIITVDNGISAVHEAKLIRELGMELVITDHHQPGRELPEATAIVDPHREDNYSPFRLYCGAGIALLLAAAINDGDLSMALEQAGDLAAVATIGDVVSLTGENRYLVQVGLAYLENTERPGLRALREVSGLAEKELTATNVAFSLVPRINAAGRLASPRLAVELLLEESPSRAQELAEQLGGINAERKLCEEKILQDIREQLAEDTALLYERVLIFSGEGWHAGVIGIVASRLQDRYGKPCMVISVKDGIGHGSARSFGAFSVFGCLTECSELLEKFGGHPAAGGFTIRLEQIPAFRAQVAEYAARTNPEMPFSEICAACELLPQFLLPENAKSLSQLEPFGADNPEPMFMVQNAVIHKICPLSGGIHTKLLAEMNGVPFESLMFRTTPERTGLRVGDICHMMVRLSVSRYMGQEKVSLIVQDIRTSGLKQGRVLTAMRTYDKYRRGESLESAYYKAACPSREECIIVYKAISEDGIEIDRLALHMYAQQINYCKMRICLDAFAELGLVVIENGATQVRRLPAKGRVDLQSSRILCDITKEASI